MSGWIRLTGKTSAVNPAAAAVRMTCKNSIPQTSIRDRLQLDNNVIVPRPPNFTSASGPTILCRKLISLRDRRCQANHLSCRAKRFRLIFYNLLCSRWNAQTDDVRVRDVTRPGVLHNTHT